MEKDVLAGISPDGQKVYFDWEGEGKPSEEIKKQVLDRFSATKFGTSMPKPEATPGWVDAIKTGAAGLGMGAGAVAGLPGGPPMQVIGAGLLGAGLEQTADYMLSRFGYGKEKTSVDRLKEMAMQVPTYAMTEATGQMLPVVVSGVGKMLTYPWGAYTGSGARALQEAYKGNIGFKKFLEGEGNLGDIVVSARGGLNALKEMRHNEYIVELEKIAQQRGELDLMPLYRQLNEEMKNFRIKFVPTKGLSPHGDFNYVDSRLESDPNAQKEFEAIVSMIAKRMRGEVSTRADQVDILKQNLRDYSSPNDKIMALVERLSDRTEKILIKNVPGYEGMVSKYKADSDLIREVLKDFSIGQRSTYESGLMKLTNAMNQNKEFKQNLLDLIQIKTGVDLVPMLAGVKLNPLVPTSTVGKYGGFFEIVKFVQKADPLLGLALASASPHISGKFLYYLGKVAPTGLRFMRPGVVAVGATSFEEPKKTEADYWMEKMKGRQKNVVPDLGNTLGDFPGGNRE